MEIMEIPSIPYGTSIWNFHMELQWNEWKFHPFHTAYWWSGGGIGGPGGASGE